MPETPKRRSSSFEVEIITLVPEIWPVMLGPSSGLVGRAFSSGLAKLHLRPLRDYGSGVHKQVDDAPFGGGAGMVLGVEPLHKAIMDARKINPGPVVLLSPRGQIFDQALAKKFSQFEGLILICGRYEGIDERIRAYVDLQVSIGDYVLSGGDPAAYCLLDAVVRLMPGVLGNQASLKEESFTQKFLEYPQYTRPAMYGNVGVPEILLSGDHAAIASFRQSEAERITRECRPDLLKKKLI